MVGGLKGVREVANFDEICKTESILIGRVCSSSSVDVRGQLIVRYARRSLPRARIASGSMTPMGDFDHSDGPAHQEAFTLICAALDTHGDRITSLEINGKGPFKNREGHTARRFGRLRNASLE